jgi:hypothetical protein
MRRYYPNPSPRQNIGDATENVLRAITKALQRERDERERLLLSLVKLETATETLLDVLEREIPKSPRITERIRCVRQILETFSAFQAPA